MKNTIMVFAIWILYSLSLHSQTNVAMGIIKGKVIDAESKVELVGAHLIIQENHVGTSTDVKGEFEIDNVPVGSYTILSRYIGYEQVIKTDIIVRVERITYVNFELQASSIEISNEAVTAGYFSEVQTQPLSSIIFSSEEIRRAPGAAGDVSRIIFGLPSLAKINDTKNSLIVRGGSPVENGFFINNIEIPSINHFPTQGSTEGPIGILNVDCIEDVNFLSGGFSSEYGDKLSSAMNIQFREGNRSTQDFEIEMSMQGFGGMLEGPLDSGRGSYLVSLRRSYLDILIDLMGEKVGIPSYSDIQGIVKYDMSPQHKISFIDVFADDRQALTQKNALESKINIYPDYQLVMNTGGINWQWIWGNNGFSNTSVAHTYTKTLVDCIQTRDEKVLLNSTTLEQEYKLRNSNHWILSSQSKLNFGFEVKYTTNDFNQTFNTWANLYGDSTGSLVIDKNVHSNQGGVYTELEYDLGSRISLKPGLRLDWYQYSNDFKLSPRISATYRFNDITSITGVYGIYYQSIPWVITMQNTNFRNLKTPRADHYVISFNHLLTESSRLTIELYDKEYSDFPMDPTQPGLFVFDQAVVENVFLNHTKLESSGKAQSYGLEVTVQKKMADGIYGLIAGSYYRARYKGLDEKWYDRVYDNKFNFAIEGGYKPNEKWEYSLRWLYAGGAPYTPFDEQASLTVHKGVFNVSQINASRLPDFHSLNLRVDRRFYFQSTTLTVYLSIWNAYGRRNIAAYTWNDVDNKITEELMWGTLPVFGIKYEF